MIYLFNTVRSVNLFSIASCYRARLIVFGMSKLLQSEADYSIIHEGWTKEKKKRKKEKESTVFLFGVFKFMLDKVNPKIYGFVAFGSWHMHMLALCYVFMCNIFHHNILSYIITTILP